ncbi:UNVERIFIED_CONTAM: hypothetical protein GTU68_048197 [Idotea baltica]|nr:hypothetical protein [Idotea baltica]
MSEEMRLDDRVFLMGEEVAEYNGAYKVTKTLTQSGGQFGCPIVFRGPSGAAGQLAQQHSQMFEAWMASVPGLKVVSCTDPADAKGLLKSAIRDDDPVCVMESELLYGHKGMVPDGEYLVPIAIELEKEGISAEVIDLRTIRPLDHHTIVESVKKTNRLVVVDESWPFSSVAAEIGYEVQKYAFDYLDAPVTRVNSADTSLGYAPTFVEEYLPNPAKVVKAVKEVMYRKA